jgi:hypothetical protein
MPVLSSLDTDAISEEAKALSELQKLNSSSSPNIPEVVKESEFDDEDIEAIVKDILYDIPFEKSYFINKGTIEIRFRSIPAEKADAIYKYVAENYKNLPEIIVKNELLSWRAAQSLVLIKSGDFVKYDKLLLTKEAEEAGLINPVWLKKSVIKSENAWRIICHLYESFANLEEKLRKEILSENFFTLHQFAMS